MNTSNNKLLITIRYLTLIFLFVSIKLFIPNKLRIDIFSVSLFLIFIIVNQLRFFYFNKNKYLIFITIIIEGFIGVKLNNLFGGIYLLYFLNAFLDCSIFLNLKYRIIVYSVLSIVILYFPFQGTTKELLITLIFLLFIGILGTFIKSENTRKLEAQKLYDKLRISETSLKKANEDLEVYANTIEEITLLRERNRISRELHDSIGHSLSAVIFQLGALERIIPVDKEKAVEMIGELITFSQSGLANLRETAKNLKPSKFENYEGILAIEEMIKNFKKITEIDVRLLISKDKYKLNSDQSFVLYRVIQEFLSNSIRHGKATKVNIFLNFLQENIYVQIKDNGVGASKIVHGFGLKSIDERVKSLGGFIEILSEKGQGFELNLSIPKKENFLYK